MLGVQQCVSLISSSGCGSKICPQNGTLVSGNMDQNLRPWWFNFDPPIPKYLQVIPEKTSDARPHLERICLPKGRAQGEDQRVVPEGKCTIAGFHIGGLQLGCPLVGPQHPARNKGPYPPRAKRRAEDVTKSIRLGEKTGKHKKRENYYHLSTSGGGALQTKIVF